MHESLKEIRTRILNLETDALTRANTDAAYFDPDKQHRISLAPLAAAHAGELLLKALIAKEHPLLLFKNISEKTTDDEIDLDWLVRNGRTHDFSRLPSVLWAATGINIPDIGSFQRIAALRNQVQHFVDERESDVRLECLNFIYSNIDPLLHEHFGLTACSYHEDEFHDYVMGCLLSCEIKFTVPPDFEFSEIDPCEYLTKASPDYKNWAYAALNIVGPGP
jgi:hypothetical protein